MELSVAMDGEIRKGAQAPISQGPPGSSLAAAPMTFRAARRWSWGLGAERRVLGRLRLLCPPCHCAAPRVAGARGFHLLRLLDPDTALGVFMSRQGLATAVSPSSPGDCTLGTTPRGSGRVRVGL